MTESQIQPDPRPVILIIDDSPDVHRLLHARLRREDVELASAHSGEEGFQKASNDPPEIILLDLDMPGMDGFEVLRALKDEPRTVQVPVIVLSGLTESTDKVTAFDLGAVDYIIKPFDVMELRVRVRSALKQASLLKMLAERAHIDGLTGLYNRQAFDENWAKCISSNNRHGTPLSLALFDLDHFKSLNDTFGHPAGDNALRVFARTMARECRASDIACRYGGEEFALIMPETTPDEAKVVCERIGTHLRAIHWPNHPERTVTVSVGVAGAGTVGGLALQPWIEAADKALYASKTGGRDRVSAVDVSGEAQGIAKPGEQAA